SPRSRQWGSSRVRGDEAARVWPHREYRLHRWAAADAGSAELQCVQARRGRALDLLADRGGSAGDCRECPLPRGGGNGGRGGWEVGKGVAIAAGRGTGAILEARASDLARAVCA